MILLFLALLLKSGSEHRRSCSTSGAKGRSDQSRDILRQSVFRESRPLEGRAGGTTRSSVYLLDPKHKERSLQFTPDQCFDTEMQAKHAAALLALFRIDPLIPHERKLPEPFRTMWLELVGRSGNAEAKLSKKDLKKLKAKEKREAKSARKG